MSPLYSLTIFTFFSFIEGIFFFQSQNRCQNNKFKIGIVGAGLSGLYSALLLQELEVEYEILEASSRIGGRFFTYHFDENEFVELGAARLPKIKLFDRFVGNQNWSLINYLNARLPPHKQLQLFPYVFSDGNNINYFNGRKVLVKDIHEGVDVYGFGMSNGGRIPDEIAKSSPKMFLDEILQDVNSKLETNFKEGVNVLLKLDRYSFAQYIMEKVKVSKEVVNWFEMFNAGKGTYSLGIFDSIISNLIFRIGKEEGFVTVRGGLGKVIDAIVSLLHHKPRLNSKVTAINKNIVCNDLEVKTETYRTKYSHVILTPTFPAIRRIFLPGINLQTYFAIHFLNYQDKVKVALRFRERFWQNPKFTNNHPISGGEASTDLPIRTVLFPSYDDNCTSCPGVLVVSYTWANDATQMSRQFDEEIEKLCLNNLEQLYGKNLLELYTGDYVIWRWGKYENTFGGIPHFNAGQWASVYPHLRKPEFNGKLHFSGDAMSVGHGWSIAALNSAYRSVENILRVEKMNDKLEQLKQSWGTIKDFELFKYE